MLRIVRADEVPVEEYHISTGRLFKRNSRLLAALNQTPLQWMSMLEYLFLKMHFLLWEAISERNRPIQYSGLCVNEHLYN